MLVKLHWRIQVFFHQWCFLCELELARMKLIKYKKELHHLRLLLVIRDGNWKPAQHMRGKRLLGTVQLLGFSGLCFWFGKQ